MLKVSLDLPSAIVIAVVLLAVVLVFWASRPSVIARYSARNQPSDAPPSAPSAPPAPPSSRGEKAPPA
ncbi:MAG TPA: hypothetical protein VLK84_13920 [Longimicrobium sp.]|nr:hypothetical protein [Longimicrobium sp.]